MTYTIALKSLILCTGKYFHEKKKIASLARTDNVFSIKTINQEVLPILVYIVAMRKNFD